MTEDTPVVESTETPSLDLNTNTTVPLPQNSTEFESNTNNTTQQIITEPTNQTDTISHNTTDPIYNNTTEPIDNNTTEPIDNNTTDPIDHNITDQNSSEPVNKTCAAGFLWHDETQECQEVVCPEKYILVMDKCVEVDEPDGQEEVEKECRERGPEFVFDAATKNCEIDLKEKCKDKSCPNAFNQVQGLDVIITMLMIGAVGWMCLERTCYTEYRQDRQSLYDDAQNEQGLDQTMENQGLRMPQRQYSEAENSKDLIHQMAMQKYRRISANAAKDDNVSIIDDDYR